MNNANAKLLYKDLPYKLQGLFFAIRNTKRFLFTNDRKNRFRKFLTFVAISISFVAISGVVSAASLYFEQSVSNIQQNIPFDVTLRLSPQDQSINAINGGITFDPKFLAVNFVNDSGSIFPIWILPPKVDEKTGQINFAGIVPGGFWQENGDVITLEFLPKNQGQTQLGFTSGTEVLLNDGKGTPAQLSQKPLLVSIGPGLNISPIQSKIQDEYPPEAFTPLISRAKDIFNNQWFLVFQTQDKGSGIDHYEVKEGSGPWQAAQSPYLLKDQLLDEQIQVKAIDRAGNFTTETLPAVHSRFLRLTLYTVIILLIAVLSYTFYIKLFKK